MNGKTYVTSDLHGYPFDGFLSLLDKAGFCDDDYLYVLGDVIDRGTDGIKLLKWLMRTPNAELLLGNHEDMMLGCRFLFEEITDSSIDALSSESMNAYGLWISNGGGPTLDALKTVRKSEIKYIVEYIEEAPLYEVITVGERDFLLTHSGLGSFSEDKKLSEYTKKELLWNRPEKDERYFDDITVVFGHTPTVRYGEEYIGRAFKTDTWIDIDAGAAMGKAPMLLCLDDMREIYM